MKEKIGKISKSIPSQLNRIDIERLKGYRTLLDFYYGIQWLGRERWGERRLTFNCAKVFIEKITSYLIDTEQPGNPPYQEHR